MRRDSPFEFYVDKHRIQGGIDCHGENIGTAANRAIFDEHLLETRCWINENAVCFAAEATFVRLESASIHTAKIQNKGRECYVGSSLCSGFG